MKKEIDTGKNSLGSKPTGVSPVIGMYSILSSSPAPGLFAGFIMIFFALSVTKITDFF